MAAGLIGAHEIFAARLASVERLTGHEVGEFAHTGDAREDQFAITAVHAMREADVRPLLADDAAGWHLLEELLDEGVLQSADYRGERFYLRPLRCSRHLL